MRKLFCLLFAVIFALCCAFSSLAVFADSENELEPDVLTDITDAGEDAVITVGADTDGDYIETIGATDGEGAEEVGATIGEDDAVAVGDVDETASPAESTKPPVGTESVKEQEFIVNYAAQTEELPDIGWLVWTVCGVLILGCLLVFGYKFIQYRNSK